MWRCIVCNSLILMDDKGLPASKYWAERDDSMFAVLPAEYVKVFCGAQCSLDWMTEQSNKEKSPPSSNNDSKSKDKTKD